jgi:hypothetical protein
VNDFSGFVSASASIRSPPGVWFGTGPRVCSTGHQSSGTARMIIADFAL